jgi:hypothetical protein
LVEEDEEDDDADEREELRDDDDDDDDEREVAVGSYWLCDGASIPRPAVERATTSGSASTCTRLLLWVLRAGSASVACSR